MLAGCRASEPAIDRPIRNRASPRRSRPSGRGTIRNLRYELSFDIPAVPTEPIAGRATIRFVATDTARPLVLDFAPVPSAVTIGRRRAASRPRFDVVNGHIVIPARESTAGENVVEIAFRAGDSPLNRNPDFLYTLFVPARAHLAFPCFDQPDLKARYTLELTVPADWQAVANGAETSRRAVGDAAPRCATPKHSRFRRICSHLRPVDSRSRPRSATAGPSGCSIAKPTRRRSRGIATRSSISTPSALAWLESYTAIPYQFGKFDFVLVPSFQFGGMEHPGVDLLQRQRRCCSTNRRPRTRCSAARA